MDASEPLWLFVDPLNTAEIPYMITGATAAILYGAPRLTNDLDLVIELTEAATSGGGLAVDFLEREIASRALSDVWRDVRQPGKRQ
jgi:hypothetical protein